MMKNASILIVDDDPSAIEGLSALFEKETFANAVYGAQDEKSALHALNCHPIDIVLLDMRLRTSHGLDLLQQIRKMQKKLQVIAVTGMDGKELFIDLLRFKINGIVHKLDGYEEIRAAIGHVLRHKCYYSERIWAIVVEAGNWDDIPSVVLSFKEKELMRALASGATTIEIAPLFKMTPKATEKFRERLIKKIGVSNAPALVSFAYRNGIL